jgi:hypothetical protein
MTRARLDQRFHPLRARLGRRALALVAAGGLADLGASPARALQGDQTCPRNAMCQIHGVTGGGVIRGGSGDISLLLFASHFAQAMTVPAFSKLTWKDPNWESGLELVNSGPIYYPHGTASDFERELTGVVLVNDGEEHPFRLRVWSAAEMPYTFDMCHMSAGDAAAAASGESVSSGGWSYEAEGPLVGGELIVIHTDGADGA